MGKKQHQADKMYVTASEWQMLYGGFKPQNYGEKSVFRRLPFYYCALSLQPATKPFCTKEGIIFDMMSIAPFLSRYGLNPVTGKLLGANELIKVKIVYDEEEKKPMCPILKKTMTENSFIIVNRVSGYMYLNEAIEQLNIGQNYWRDLMTHEPFVRSDLIVIQDPKNIGKFNINEFYYFQNKLLNEKKEKNTNLNNPSISTQFVLDELERNKKKSENVEEKFHKKFLDTNNKISNFAKAAHNETNQSIYSTGKAAASFTSTVVELTTNILPAYVANDEIIIRRLKSSSLKGYIQLITSLGVLNIQLETNYAPLTCRNFLELCQQNFYDGTIFHRSIPNFMIQGGDPKGNGEGGRTAREGEKLKDEFHPNLLHDRRGIVSMAKKEEADSGTSQFFITYKSAKHLDKKHSIFGKVVGGMNVLDKMEQIPVNKKDRPTIDISILSTEICINPYLELEKEIEKEQNDEKKKKKGSKNEKNKSENSKKRLNISAPVNEKLRVGKYIKRNDLERLEKIVQSKTKTMNENEKKLLINSHKRNTENYRMKDFSSW
ncbi:hypothetical protein SNEBB_008544 [Seison nebaliae]|nr:hypothetical protein SNEBB_008544 [Seison nebaliae]